MKSLFRLVRSMTLSSAVVFCAGALSGAWAANPTGGKAANSPGARPAKQPSADTSAAIARLVQCIQSCGAPQPAIPREKASDSEAKAIEVELRACLKLALAKEPGLKDSDDPQQFLRSEFTAFVKEVQACDAGRDPRFSRKTNVLLRQQYETRLACVDSCKQQLPTPSGGRP